MEVSPRVHMTVLVNEPGCFVVDLYHGGNGAELKLRLDEQGMTLLVGEDEQPMLVGWEAADQLARTIQSFYETRAQR